MSEDLVISRTIKIDRWEVGVPEVEKRLEKKTTFKERI